MGRKFKIQLDKGWILCYNRGMNDQQLQLIQKKYGNLIHKIGHSISGDVAICDHDDNTQDLWIAVMDAIRGYERKEGKPFEQFCNDKGFDKYLKTCLWNLKNSKGARLTKRQNINRDAMPIDSNEEIIHVEDNSVNESYFDMFFDDLPSSLSDDERNIIRSLVDSPDFVCENGRINIKALSSKLNKGWGTTRKIVDRIGEKIKNNL